jgi:WD40 repeat protein
VLKRGTVIFIVVLVGSLAVLAYYLKQKREAYIASPYKTIPVDAGMILEAVNLPDLLEELASDNNIIAEMEVVDPLHRFRDGIISLDSIVHTRDIRSFFGSVPVLISFHQMGRDRVELFYSMALPPEIKERHLREIISNNSSLSYGIKEYQGYRVFEVETRDVESISFYLSYVKGVLIASKSRILVESGIRQSEQLHDIRSSEGFSEVLSAAGRNDNKLIFVFDNFQKIAALAGRGDSPLTGISRLASSAETDIYIKSNNLTLSGYIEAGDSTRTLSAFLKYSPGSFDTYLVIPSNVAMFESLTGISDWPSVNRTDIEGVTRYLADIVRSQLEGELTKMYFNLNGEDHAYNKMTAFKLKGLNATEKAFAEELDNYYSRIGKGREDYMIEYKPDDESSYSIYRLPDSRLPEALAGSFVSGYKGGYATFFDGYLVLGERHGSISKFIYDNILNRTLANDIAYREFESTLPSRSAYYFYAVPSKILDVMPDLVNDNIMQGLEKYINSLKKVQAVGLQLSPSNDMIYTTLSFLIEPEISEEASAQWESLLDTVLYSKPMFFTNHYTGRNEIFVQDLNNNVSLINSAGRILWKLRLSEKIVGDPVMIDYYRNSKYQILFATENNLHLLDRNGNYVERYPVKLRAPATNGLAVFDYENNKDYRLFICGNDRLVYLYDKSGNTVKGWNQFKTHQEVKSQIEFFRVSGKDYLVVNDSENMYILDRRGNERVKVKEPVARAPHSAVRLTNESYPRLILSSVDGSLKLISFNGDVETVSLGDFTEDHIFDQFDIDSDGMDEYIFVDEGKIYAFDNNRSRMFVTSTGSDNILGPYGLVFGSNDKKIGYVDAAGGHVYIIDSRGKTLRGFPLAGSTPFSVGKLTGSSSFNLITGGRDSFIYNYELKR